MKLKWTSGSLRISLRSFIIIRNHSKFMKNSSAPNSTLHPHSTPQRQSFKVICFISYYNYHQHFKQYDFTSIAWLTKFRKYLKTTWCERWELSLLLCYPPSHPSLDSYVILSSSIITLQGKVNIKDAHWKT